MSGRVRWKRDGKLITGYRKTDRRQSEAVPTSELPDFVLRYLLPTALGFGLIEGPAGMIGVAITVPGPYVEVRGKRWQWVVEQGAAFLRKIAKPAGMDVIVEATLKRAAYPGVASGSPYREAVSRSLHLVYVGADSVVIPRALDGPMIFSGE
jgi:hypothetical protein